jgi:recombination protein RecA
MTEEKTLNLADFAKFVQKTSGKTAIIDAVEKESYGDVIPVTSLSLRLALGIGGVAKRKLLTLDGDLSSGKSTTAYDIIANCQKTYGEQCLLIDKEDSYTTEYGEVLGIDNNKLTIVTPHTLEEMYSIVIEALKSKLFGCIVVDSVTSFAPAARFEDSGIMGIEARINSDKMRLVADALSHSNTSLVFIQQTREKIGGMGDPTTVSGGKAIPFYAHARIRITRSQIDRENMQNIMKFTVIKNKMAAPFKVGTVAFVWGKGFDYSSEIAQLAAEFGVIPLQGRTYTLPETSGITVVGKKKLIQYLEDNPEYTKQVIEPIVSKIIEEDNVIRTDEGAEELG